MTIGVGEQPNWETLAAQATAVELQALNLLGHCDNLQSLISRGKRLQDELDLAQVWLPALQEAAVTMKWLASHADELRDRGN